MKRARGIRAWEIFRNTERVRGARRRADTTGLSGWIPPPCVHDTPTGRRNKILLKLIRALGHVCKESRRRRGRRDSPPKVDRSVWARYFNEFWYFDTFPTSCYVPPCTVVCSHLPDIFIATSSPPLLHRDCRATNRRDYLSR